MLGGQEKPHLCLRGKGWSGNWRDKIPGEDFSEALAGLQKRCDRLLLLGWQKPCCFSQQEPTTHPAFWTGCEEFKENPIKFKEDTAPILHQLFQKIEEKRKISQLLYKVNIILIPSLTKILQRNKVLTNILNKISAKYSSNTRQGKAHNQVAFVNRNTS